MPMALEVNELTSLAALERRGPQYEEVFAHSDEKDIFIGLQWIANWWRVYGEGRKMLVLEVLENGRPVGYAPFMMSSIGKLLRVRILEFIGTGPSDRLGILAEDGRSEVHEAIWKYLDSDSRWDTMDLRDMREDGSTAGIMIEHFPNAQKEISMAPFIPLLGEHKDYLSSLTGNVRHSLNRLWRRLSQDHDAKFASYHAPEDMDFCYRTLLELNAMRWKTIGTSTLESVQMKEFVRRTVQTHAPKGQIAFHMLHVRGVPIAITYGFVFQNRYLYYLSGFNPEYSNYGPGKSLLSKIIEDCYARGYDEVDFLRGGEQYKYSLNPINRSMFRVKLENKGLKGRLSGLLRND